MALALASTSGGTVLPVPPLPPAALPAAPPLPPTLVASPPSVAASPALPLLPPVVAVPPKALLVVPALLRLPAVLLPLPLVLPAVSASSPSSVLASLAQEAASGTPRVRYRVNARSCQVLVIGRGARAPGTTAARQPSQLTIPGTGSHR